MRPRRTAIVPHMIWGTAIASIIPSQLVGCGGSATEPGAAGSVNHAGSGGHAGHIAEGGKNEGYGGYIVLAIRAFGGDGPAFGGAPSGGTGGAEVLMAGTGGYPAGTGGHAAGAGGHAAGTGGHAAGVGWPCSRHGWPCSRHGWRCSRHGWQRSRHGWLSRQESGSWQWRVLHRAGRSRFRWQQPVTTELVHGDVRLTRVLSNTPLSDVHDQAIAGVADARFARGALVTLRARAVPGRGAGLGA